jgi:hypothetical protein
MKIKGWIHIEDGGDDAPIWVAVEDGLPEKDDEYLVYDGQYIFTTAFCNNIWRDERESTSMKELEPITHWMPLPEPPKASAAFELEEYGQALCDNVVETVIDTDDFEEISNET